MVRSSAGASRVGRRTGDVMSESCVTSPVCVAGDDLDARVVRCAVESLGYRVAEGIGPAAPAERPVSVVSEQALSRGRDRWLAYVQEGGWLAAVSPDAAMAEGVPGGATTAARIVEHPLGRGRLLRFTFPLGASILALQRRTREDAEANPGSAERMILSGADRDTFRTPCLDEALQTLSRFLSRGAAVARRPMWRFCRLPKAKRIVATFSFDDGTHSGKPLRRALQSGRLASMVREGWRYSRNAADDARALVEMFETYGARGTVFVLPAFGPLNQALGLVGYSGVSSEMVRRLCDGGWELATHLTPRQLNDYDRLARSFRARFGKPASGHRGHELGWVGWTEDWERLAALGYTYDSTWCWGGHDGLAWTSGSGFPYSPWSANGSPVNILEFPVQAWLEDQVDRPEAFMGELVSALDRYPGVYHVAGHTWRMRESAYGGLVESMLAYLSDRADVGGILPLADVARFWMGRARSALQDLVWEDSGRRVAATVVRDSGAEGLAVDIALGRSAGAPVHLRVNGDVRAANVQERDGDAHVVWIVQENVERIELEVGDVPS